MRLLVLLPIVLAGVLAGVLVALAALTLSGQAAQSADAARPLGEQEEEGLPFRRGSLDAGVTRATSLAFGPDERLYVATLTSISALTLDGITKEVLAVEEIASELEDVIGIAFDPTAPASPVVIYASGRDAAATDGFQSRISTFTAPDWERVDVITGLPTSRPFLNHLTNGLAFDSTGRLYIAQGSATDGGVASSTDGPEYWPETPLSAAILTADIHAAGFDGAITYQPAGPPADHDVDQMSGDVTVYAPGFRNPYDLVVHSNGRIYATDNGPIGPEYAASCFTSGTGVSFADELNLVEEGSYYGHPNRNRGRSDARQCAYRPGDDGDSVSVTGPIALLPQHCSCNGITEYDSPAFDGALLGDLLFVGWTSGDLFRAELSADGLSVVAVSTLAGNFDQPLDVTVGPDGTIYIAEFDDERIAYLQPDSGTPAPTATALATATMPATVTPTPSQTPTPTPPGLAGDVDCDGGVTSIDAALVLQQDAGLIDTLPCAENGDLNGDGARNAIDAAIILQIDAGLLALL